MPASKTESSELLDKNQVLTRLDKDLLECRNCQHVLHESQDYCGNCGAKLIRNRLTVKNLWDDFSGNFLNVDNSILRTFIHLFTKPELVIAGYIRGVRKKYVHPLGYLAFSIILSGTMYLILKKGFDISFNPETVASGMEKIYDYNTFLVYLGLPLYASASFLIFIDKDKYNFTEHLVINSYWIAQLSIVQFLTYPFIFGLFNLSFTSLEIYAMISFLLYLLYILRRMYGVSFWNTFFRGLLYVPLYFLAGMVSMIPVMIYMLLTGEIGVADLVPKK